MLNKGKTKILREWRRVQGVLRRVPLKAWIASGSLSLVIIVAATCLSIVNGRYALSDAQLGLLGKSGIDSSDLKETSEAYVYNMAEDIKDDTTRKVVAGGSESDSTPDVPYQASLSKDPSKGLIFGDAEGHLSFSLVPNQPSMEGKAKEGRVIYPSSTGKKSVYTFKINGVKEDILLERAPSKVIEYSWNLELGDKLEAKQMPDGSIGIFAADPLLYGDLQVADDKSQKLVDRARENGEKTHMVFNLPAPYIIDAEGRKNIEDVSYKLEGNLLTLEARNMVNKHYPLSIDPTVVVTTTAEFRVGYDDGMIDYTTTSNEIQRTAVTIGDIGTFTIETDFLPDPRAYHASVAYGGFLYVIGGFTSNLNQCDNDAANTTECNDVLYATINSDGSISAPTCTGGTLTGVWCSDGDYFSKPRHDHTAVVYNNFLYVIGGTNGVGNDECDGGYGATTLRCNDVQYASINSDGSIGSFQTDGDRFSVPRAHHASVVYNGYLYVIGGEGADTNTCEANGASSLICDDVQYAPINADGSIGAFQTNSNRLDDPRYGIAASAYNGYLYVTGGMGLSDGICDADGAVVTSLCDEVLYASINGDGSTGSFTLNTEIFADPRYNHTTVAYGGYLYVIGGNGGAANVCEDDAVDSFQCNDLQYAQVNADGSVGQFSLGSDYFDEPRESHTSVVYNGRIYVIAGAGDDTNNDDCDVGVGDYTHCSDVQYATITASTPAFTPLAGSFREPDFDDEPQFHFDYPRSAHATIAYNGYLYVIGGAINATSTNCKNSGASTSLNCNDVQYAPIGSDGLIGDWTTDTDTESYFDVPRNGHIGFAYNGYIYIVGGSNSTLDECEDEVSISTTSCNDIQYAPVNADGSLGAWTIDAGDRFDTPRVDHSSFAYNGYLYVAGGVGGAGNSACDTEVEPATTKCNDVQYAPINSDGSIGSFTTDAGDRFDYARSALMAVAYNGYIYITGGNNAESTDTECHDAGLGNNLDVCNDVQFASIAGDGSLGSFSATNNFITPRMRLGTVAQNGYLYVFGGFQDTNDTACKNVAASRYCNDLQAVEINSNGTVDFFAVQSYFDSPRHVKATTYNGYLYVVGGFSSSSGTQCKDFTQSSMAQCNDYQVSAILTPAQRATYERVFDVGDSGTNVRINSVEFNGQAVCGATVMYKTAGADGIFGSAVSQDAVPPGAELSINELNKRYVLVRYTLTDDSCGTQSNIEDITLNWQYDPPDAPTLNTLADGAISQPLTSIAFQFRSPQANGSYLRYKIDICNDAACTSHVSGSPFDQTASQTGWSGQDTQTSTAYVGNAVIGSSTMATFTFSGTLAVDNDYYWRAYAIDPAKSNTWSPASVQRIFYTNYRPAIPTLNAPSNNAAGVSVTPEFRFTSIDQDSDYIRYRIRICQDSGCSSQISGSPFDQTASQTGWSGQGAQGATAYNSGQEAIFTLQTQLALSTQYWWEVEAKDPGGTDQWSTVSARNTFTTSTTTGASTIIRGGTTIQGGTRF